MLSCLAFSHISLILFSKLPPDLLEFFMTGGPKVHFLDLHIDNIQFSFQNLGEETRHRDWKGFMG